MTKLYKIKERLSDYKKTADEIIGEFVAAENKAKARYSEMAFKEELNLNIFPKHAGKIRAEADWAIREINEILDEAEEEFTKWIMKPLDYSTAQTLDCIAKFDLRLSLPELQAIEPKVTESYFGQRIFEGIAGKSGYSVKIPNMKDCMDALQSVRNEAGFAISAYAGEVPFLGRELIGNWIYNNVDYGRYASFHHNLALNKLKSFSDIDRLEQLLELSKAPISYELSPKERKETKEKIVKLIKNGEVIEDEAIKIVEADPNFVGKLECFLSEEDGRGYAKEPEEKNALEKYFKIGGFRDPDPYQISQIRKMDGTSAGGKVDESILAEFK